MSDPSSRHEKFAVTITANTPIASPHIGSMAFAPGVVNTCWVTFPLNCQGLVGVQIQHGGQSIVPWTGPQYLISDNYTYQLDTTGWPNGGAWSLLGYNLDPIFDHTIHVVFGVSELALASKSAGIYGQSTPIDLSALGSGNASDLADQGPAVAIASTEAPADEPTEPDLPEDTSELEADQPTETADLDATLPEAPE